MAKKADLSTIKRMQTSFEKLRAEIGKVIVGQDEVVEQLLIAIFSRGHCIIEGVPGLAKTLLIKTLADCLRLDFSRIQFTPDLMPTDITGTEVIHESASGRKREFRFLKGPIFANVILADEINRTPPKTQAALLEAMQEGQVTVGGKSNPLPDPFFVLATQNPIEQEGTYPLPEAQQDRFLFKIFIKYPSREEEYDIIRQTTEQEGEAARPVFSKKAITDVQEIVRRVPVAEPVVQYAMSLVRKTRVDDESGEDTPDFIKEYVSWGAGPGPASAWLQQAKRRRCSQDGSTLQSRTSMRSHTQCCGIES